GVDLLKGSRGSNLYPISLEDILKSSPICLLSKASKTKSWLWHRRLLHLNFNTINQLAKEGLVKGLPKLKYEKDYLCSTCSLGKSRKYSHKPKAKDSNQEKLYLLHMNLYGPMRVESIPGKKYVLVIVDDYTSYYEDVGITRQTSVARTLQQNDVVERRNRTLVEPPSGVVSPMLPAVVPLPADITGIPSTTTIVQDALSVSTSSTT
ncbi:retrovirus-related pol polyprotein from transposon TNT 1-94, partial [Tanacetum coccineum]